MASLYGSIILDNNSLTKDKLYLSGDKKLMALILTLVDSQLVIEPKITSKKSYLQILKNPPSNITLKLGDDKISKEVLLTSLQFAGIIK